jgi:Fungal chitosanase of glycosyl hydrolase group 75
MSDLTKFTSIGGVSIYKDSKGAIIWKSSFAVNADGSPHAYAPDNSGLDYTANAGSPGNWWGVWAPPDGKGQPIVQAAYHPAPGHYISTTALVDPNYPDGHPDRYVDSERYGFYVIPGGQSWCKLGDVGLALNTKTGDNFYFAMGDIGPQNQIGEGSMLLAKCLGLSTDPKKGGTDQKIIACVVLPNSDPGYKDWEPKCKLAIKLVDAWGGLARLKQIAAEI